MPTTVTRAMKELDDLDTKILLALEEDARVSLKQLAQELGIKTSTIYHRLHRLQESNVLDGFTVVLNPGFLNIDKHCLLVISLKNLLVKNLDSMFVSSFAKFLEEQFPECLLISVGTDNQVYLLSAHADEGCFEEFHSKLKKIPYIDTIQVVNMQQIVKGFRLYKYSNVRPGAATLPVKGARAGTNVDDGNLEEIDDLEIA